MRPVAASIRVNPPAATQTDPRPTARPPMPSVSRSTVVMTLPETGSMRTTTAQPVRPVDADPDLLAVARHRAVQRHPQTDLVGRGIDPHHLTHVVDAHPDTTGSGRHDLRPIRSRSDRSGSSRRPVGRGIDARDRFTVLVGHPHRACCHGHAQRLRSDRDRRNHLAGDRVDPQEGVVLVVRLPDGTGSGRQIAVLHPVHGKLSRDGGRRQIHAHQARGLVDPERLVVGSEPARLDWFADLDPARRSAPRPGWTRTTMEPQSSMPMATRRRPWSSWPTRSRKPPAWSHGTKDSSASPRRLRLRSRPRRRRSPPRPRTNIASNGSSASGCHGERPKFAGKGSILSARRS